MFCHGQCSEGQIQTFNPELAQELLSDNRNTNEQDDNSDIPPLSEVGFQHMVTSSCGVVNDDGTYEDHPFGSSDRERDKSRNIKSGIKLSVANSSDLLVLRQNITLTSPENTKNNGTLRECNETLNSGREHEIVAEENKINEDKWNTENEKKIKTKYKQTVESPEEVRMSENSIVKRVYATSPVFGMDEEEEFYSVRSQIDDYAEIDDATDRALNKTVAVIPEEHLNTHEDKLKRDSSSSSNEHSDVEKQYVLRSSKYASEFKEDNSHQESAMLRGLSSMPSTLSDGEELQQEKDYQANLKERIMSQSKLDADTVVPKLSLGSIDDDMEESHEGMQKRINNDGEQHYFHDSLEIEYPDRGYKEYKQFQPSERRNISEDEFLPPPRPFQYLQAHAGPLKADHQILPKGFWSNQQMLSNYNARYLNEEAVMSEHNHPYYIEQAGDFEKSQPRISQYGYGNKNSHNEISQHGMYENAYIDQINHPAETSQSSRMFAGHHDRPLQPVKNPKQKAQVNYVKYNKSNLGKENSFLKRSYIQMLSQRKAGKNAAESFKVALDRRRSGKSEPPPHECVPLSTLKKPSSAEELWRNRSSSLLSQKEMKLVQKQPGKLKKFPSDSRVHMLERTPHYLEPLAHKPQVYPDKLSPTSSLQPVLVQTAAPQPITRDIWTDSGQRISVDINLNLLSPSHKNFSDSTFQRQPFNSPQRMQRLQGGFRAEAASLENGYYQPPLQNPRSTNDELEYKGTSDRPLDSAHSTQEDEVASCHSSQPTQNNKNLTTTNLVHPMKISSEYFALENKNSHPQPGYMDQYRKQQNRRGGLKKYKVYGINDYRQMQKEVKLGSLGPDRDNESLREKVEKRQKQVEYARQVHELNRHSLATSKSKLPPVPQPNVKDNSDQMNRRRLALEYARNVPKPTVKPDSVTSGETSPQLDAHSRATNKPVPSTIDVIDLEKLHQRHQMEKQNAASIKQNIGKVS